MVFTNSAHRHSWYLDFDNDKVRCSYLGCQYTFEPAHALVLAWPELTLEIARAKLKEHGGKVYVIKMGGEYLCTITGYTVGVLHLLDFCKMEYFEQFKEIVGNCFGVNHIAVELKKRRVE